MNNRLRSSVTLTYVLHVFIQGVGTGTATLEAKLSQQLVGMCHDPLFQVFLHVFNSYYSLYRGRRMGILRGYGIGNKLQRLIQRFWYEQLVVTRDGRFYGWPFRTERGVT